MGTRNVAAVLMTWHTLPARTRVVLCAMANASLDDPKPGEQLGHGAAPRRYFGGVGYLAEVLYGPDGIEGYDHNGNAVPTASARRQVQKTITELVAAGALDVVVKGRPGRRAEWTINLAPAVDSPLLATTRDDRNGRPETTETVATIDRNGRPETTETVPLKRTIKRTHEYREENITFLNHVESRATSASAEQGSSSGRVEQYDAAYAYLQRTLGTTDAASRVATILGSNPDGGYRAAVVELARAEGFTPAPTETGGGP
jgi:hypothetical protein